jgi:hypothetical protein
MLHILVVPGGDSWNFGNSAKLVPERKGKFNAHGMEIILANVEIAIAGRNKKVNRASLVSRPAL